jgi:hypothetical protein
MANYKGLLDTAQLHIQAIVREILS